MPGERIVTVDLGVLVETSPCAHQLSALEECLGEHSRAWSKCQSEVAALKACNQKVLADKDKAAGKK